LPEDINGDINKRSYVQDALNGLLTTVRYHGLFG
jgi:hypothetical protein